MAFDYVGALEAGYTPDQIAKYLSDSRGFDYEGATQAGYTPDQIIEHILAPKTGGFGEATKHALKSQYISTKTGIESLLGGTPEDVQRRVEEQAQIKELPGTSWDEVQRKYEHQGLWEAAKEAASQIPGGIGQGIGSMAPTVLLPVAGGVVGGALGSVVPGAGTALGAQLGTAAGTALAAAPYFGANLERQQQEHPGEINKAAALGAAIPEYLLDRYAGVGKVLGSMTKRAAPEGMEALRAASKAARGQSLAGQAARGIGRTAAEESLTEVTQQGLERAQAGLPLTGDEAMKEYKEAGFGALLASPIGGPGRIVEGGRAQSDYLRALQEQRDLRREQPDYEQKAATAAANWGIYNAQATGPGGSAAFLPEGYLAQKEAEAAQASPVTEPALQKEAPSVQDIINQSTGVSKEAAPTTAKSKAFRDFLNEPSGIMARDPETQVERELTNWEAVQQRQVEPAILMREAAARKELSDISDIEIQHALDQQTQMQIPGLEAGLYSTIPTSEEPTVAGKSAKEAPSTQQELFTKEGELNKTIAEAADLQAARQSPIVSKELLKDIGIKPHPGPKATYNVILNKDASDPTQRGEVIDALSKYLNRVKNPKVEAYLTALEAQHGIETKQIEPAAPTAPAVKQQPTVQETQATPAVQEAQATPTPEITAETVKEVPVEEVPTQEAVAQEAAQEIQQEQPISPETRQELRDVYNNSANMLADKFGGDLSNWKNSEAHTAQIMAHFVDRYADLRDELNTLQARPAQEQKASDVKKIAAALSTVKQAIQIASPYGKQVTDRMDGFTSPEDLFGFRDQVVGNLDNVIMKAGRAFVPSTRRFAQEGATQGKPLDSKAMQHAAKGDLNGLIRHLANTHENKDVRRILNKIQGLGLKSSLVLGGNTAGSYDAATNTVSLHPEHGVNDHTAVHEIIHAAISHVLANPHHPLTKEFQTYFDQIQNQLGDVYGATSLQEFAAELVGNPEFQVKLKNIQSPSGQSMFRRIAQAIAEFFGFKKGQSAYEKGIDMVERAIDVSQNDMGGLDYVVNSIHDSTNLFDAEEISKMRHVGWKSKEKLVNMPIDAFLQMAAPIRPEQYRFDNAIKEFEQHGKFLSVPYLWGKLGNDNKVHWTGHEGRHRAMMLKAMGYETMPVRMNVGGLRWSEQSNPAKFDYKESWPTHMVGENGTEVEFPISRERAAHSYSRAILYHQASNLYMGMGKPVKEVFEAMKHVDKEAINAKEAVLDAFSNLKDSTKYKLFIDSLGLDNIADLLSSRPQASTEVKNMSVTMSNLVHNLSKTIDLRSGEMAKRIHDTSNKFITMQKAYSRHTKAFKDMSKLAIEARLESVDPLKGADYQPNKDNPVAYNRILHQYSKLPADVKSAYATMRGDFEKARQDYLDIMFNSIDGLYKDNPSVAAALKKKYETDPKVIAYVPFSRHGDFVLEFDVNGERNVLQFESSRQRQAYVAKHLKGAPYKLYERLQDVTYDASSVGRQSLIGQVMNELQKTGATQDQLNSIYQIHLSMFPAESISKHFMKSDDVKGMSEDLLRNYTDVMLRWDRKLVSTKYMGRINADIQAAKDLADKVQDPLLHSTAQSLLDRRGFINNPTHSSWSNKATAFSYYQFIAGNISSAFVNLAVIPTVVIPKLAAMHSGSKALNAMDLAMRTGLKDWSKIPKYRKLYEEMMDRNQLTHTLDKEALEGRAMSSEGYTGLTAKAATLLSIPFAASEKYNRAVTAIAAYDLYLSKHPGKVDDAIEHAVRLVKNVHTSGMAASGSKLFHSNIGRIFFTFKSFAWNSAYNIARTAYLAWKGEDKATVQMARRQLLMTYGAAGAFSGVAGLPFYGMASTLFSIMSAMFGDDDEPTTLDEELKAALGEGATHGVLGALLNLNIGQRTSLANDLLLRDNPRMIEQHGRVLTYMAAMFGPAGAYALGAGDSLGLIQNGHVERGLEGLIPSFARNALKGARYMAEGAQTIKGDYVKEDVSTYNSLMQIIGFAPADLSEIQGISAARKRLETAIFNEKKRLLDEYDMGYRAGDSEYMKEVQEKITAFNQRHPYKGVMITPDTIARSRRTRLANEKFMLHGIRFNKHLIQELQSKYPEPDESEDSEI